MARPRNENLKAEVRTARAAGASIDALCHRFLLSKNTVFYHLREDPNRDGRRVYSPEEKVRLANLGPAGIKDEAQRLGKTVTAVERAAYRARKEVEAREREEREALADEKRGS